MDKEYESYRQRANQAFRMADQSISDLEKSAWLLIAQGWLELIKSRARKSRALSDQAPMRHQTLH
jgi:hypothetical protein